MKDLMPWSECTKKFIRKVSVDASKINSLVEIAGKRRIFIQSVKVNSENVSFIFDGYYEVVKELLIALMLKNGLRSRNHQCLFTFFDKEYNYDTEVNLMSQMNFLRNRLNYYGEAIEFDYFKENYKSFEKLIDLLMNLITK
jgi:uncharacterized protein (UPF0332 family)